MAYRAGGNGGGGHATTASGGAYSEDERDSRSGGDERPGSVDLGDKPTYLLEHLATFTVNKESGIVTPADGMRRLLMLEKTTGIWSQKMQLCLDRQWVLIMDYESGNVMERFPASLIQEPTAFTSNGPMEMYNNVLVLIVGGGNNTRSEMHIFQCQSISAVLLEQDLKNLRAGKLIAQRDDRQHQQPAQSASRHERKSPSTSSTVQQQHHHQQQQQQQQHQQLHQQHNNGGRDTYNNFVHVRGADQRDDTDSDLDAGADETSSTSSEKYEKDVTVLNHCFDDIEKFIARLQHAAAASRELERRRRNRKSKKKDPGEGLLTLRTKPPHEREFVDIFAKFKLSFNLLAKLKAHIHDPNAPELVHFLFTPLALIVDASHDTYYEPIPARVVQPLMTREAVNLLINCVTSKETELWRSLGDAWLVPRDQWKGAPAAYHPVFFDGWSPDYSVMDELDNPSTPTVRRRLEPLRGFGAGGAAQPGGYDEYDPPTPTSVDKYHRERELHGGGGGGPMMPMGSPRDFSARSDISIDSIERNGGHVGAGPGPGALPVGLVHQLQQPHQLHQLHGQPMHEQQLHHAAVPPPPSMTTAATVHGHQLGGGGAGGAALSADAWLDEVQSRGGKIVQVTYPRTANNDKELTVVRGEYLEILDDSRKWWKARNSSGHVAHVPHTIITPLNYNDNGDTFNNPLYTQNYNKNFNNGRQSVANDNDRYSQQPAQQQQKQPATTEHRNGSPSSASGIVPVAINTAASAGASQADWVRNKHTDRPPIRSSFSSDDNVFTPAPSSLKKSAMAMPPPPPPPMPPVVAVPVLTRSLSKTNTTASRKSMASTAPNGQDEMQEELKSVLTMFRDKRRILDIVKTPEIYIQQTSTAADVEQWLVAKGFSGPVVKKLNGFNGNELFSLKRHTMEDYFGTEEGRRLASQITIQRNISGYKTARSTELQAMLAKARTKTGEQ